MGARLCFRAMNRMDIHGTQTRAVIEEICEPHVDWMLTVALVMIGLILIGIGLAVEDRAVKSFALAYVALPI